MKFLILLAFFSTTLFAQTQEEWHEYCEMTVHVHVDGWEVENVNKKMLLKGDFQKINCKVEYAPTYIEGEFQTIVTAKLNLKTNIGNKLVHPGFSHMNYLSGKVDKDEACARINDLKNESSHEAVVERRLVKQEWSSPKNTDTYLIEDVTLKFENGAYFTSSQILFTKGKYCSKKPSLL